MLFIFGDNNICKCGCNQLITYKYHHKYHNPEFISGHQNYGRIITKEATQKRIATKKKNGILCNFKDVDLSLAKRMYGEGYSLTDVAKKFRLRYETLSKKFKQNNISIRKNSQFSAITLQRKSKYLKSFWQIKSNKEKRIKQVLKGLFKNPTSYEKKVIDVINKYNLPYRYTGDGGFLIGHKSPDFVNFNGEKICLEIRSHKINQTWAKISDEEYISNRINHFKRYGWECKVLVIDNPDEKDILNFFRKEVIK